MSNVTIQGMQKKGFVIMVLFFTLSPLFGFGPGGGVEDLWSGVEDVGYVFGSSVMYEDGGEMFSRERNEDFSQPAGGSAAFTGSIGRDEEGVLDAPPPGESGTPQKMVPVGGSDWQAYLLFSLFGICYMQGKSKR